MTYQSQVRTCTVHFAPLSEAALKASYKHEPETHEECTDEKHGAATPFVDKEDRGDYEER